MSDTEKPMNLISCLLQTGVSDKYFLDEKDKNREYRVIGIDGDSKSKEIVLHVIYTKGIGKTMPLADHLKDRVSIEYSPTIAEKVANISRFPFEVRHLGRAS